jgi:hypothetical protein
MMETSRQAALWALVTTASLAMALPAFSQQPTDAQRSAIRSQCRADYEAHCASVPPGGMASLQCLQKNMSSLAPGCQNAVRAVEAAAEPKADTNKADTNKADTGRTDTTRTDGAPAAPAAKPAAEAPAPAAAPKAAAATPATKPSSAQVAAIRSACRADYQRNCASVPPGGAASLTCLQQHKAKLSASCQQAVNAAGGGVAPAAAGATAAATAAPEKARATIALRPMRPREELFVLRSACGADVRALCSGIPVGGGRIARCLANQAASLSPACKEVLASFAAR